MILDESNRSIFSADQHRLEMRYRRLTFLLKCVLFGIVLRICVLQVFAWKNRYFRSSPSKSIGIDGKSYFGDRHREYLRISTSKLDHYASAADFGETPRKNHDSSSSTRRKSKLNFQNECSMSTCFNFTRCRGRPFKVHIYPTTNLEELIASASNSTSTTNIAYSKILSSIVRSGTYTSDPSQACLFVVAFDTLDRDLRGVDYVRNLDAKFAQLPSELWNNGENHLIFNLYPGTWPDYNMTDLGIRTGEAILVKASFSIGHFRPNFDVSLPLFHRILPLAIVEEDDELFRPLVSSSAIYGSDAKRRRYLYSFKGKRYVHGIGSETRNTLYHLHDCGRQSVVLTTCKHGKNWEVAKDERCDVDNEAYDRWTYSYEWLLAHSDFCLVPRGRRLGSYRFLESLQYGCVPMILANDWELPFSEIVPWSEASVMADERLLSMVPDILQEIETARAFGLRQNAKRLSQMYFSSVDRIVATTLEIIKRRLQPWMPSPLDQEHFGGTARSSEPSSTSLFHAYVSLTSKKNSIGSTRKLLESISASAFCSGITILCFDCSISKIDRPSCPIEVIKMTSMDSWPVLKKSSTKKAEAIFWIDQSAMSIPFSTDEIDFAMQVWRYFPDRLIGYFARRHQPDGRLTSKLLNDYTFITGTAVVYHESYNDRLDAKLGSLPFDRRLPCFDRLLNQLAIESGRAPIKLTARYQSNGRAAAALDGSMVSDEECFGGDWNSTEFAVKASRVRFDPILYKDSVSNLRKKYRQMEMASN